MKKQILSALVIFLFVITLVIAQAVLNNRDITLTKTQKITLESIDLGDYNTADYELNGKYQRCLNKKVCGDREIKHCYFESNFINENQTDYEYICDKVIVQDCKSVINTCSSYMGADELDGWEKQRIEGIADVVAKRRISVGEKVGEGITTIK